MRIALAQLDPTVGDFEKNVQKIKESYDLAVSEGARLLLTPELGLMGYPPHDLLTRPEIFQRNERALTELKSITQGKKTALVVGHVARNPKGWGRRALNQVSVIEDGNIVFEQAKTLLPTYDVFDEARYFQPAEAIKLWECDGKKIALAICEDLWAEESSRGRKLYPNSPTDTYAKLGAELVISVSASPYEWGKREKRESLHQGVAKALGAPLFYVNQVGATDEILFDGASFVLGADGSLKGRLPVFERGMAIFDLSSEAWIEKKEFRLETTPPSEIESLRRALVMGIREYFHRTGFQKAVMGLSGGIDSSVVAVLTSEAIGSENVFGLAMPSQYSSPESLEDAQTLAKNLKMPFDVKPIKFLFSVMSREFSPTGKQLKELTQENLQARLRGLFLMTYANDHHALVVTTGNKSELATGYCTQYGDMVGAIAPLGDVFKKKVFELARWLNHEKEVIPAKVLEKPPSAELRPNQKDEDTLPPYDVLDDLLMDYLENRVSVEELKKKYEDRLGETKKGWVTDLLKLIERNEYKRRQAAPVLKTSPKAFGIGRRIPIAKVWDQV